MPATLTAAAEPARSETNQPSPPRLESVDLLRGLVMVVMVLDHVRDFFTNDRLNPMDLSATTPGWYLTRWVTHFCAPAFVFLAGTGTFLAATRGKTRPELSWFLLTRGIWLIVLEVTAVRFGLTFNLDYRYVSLGVLWAIGASMIVLAALIYLPMPVVAAFGILVMAGHNLLDPIELERFGRLGWLWTILHQKGHLRPFGADLLVLYPLIPWVGVMATGYAFGSYLLLKTRRRRQMLFVIGVSLIGAFVTLRAINLYGDPAPWSEQKSGLFTAFAFLDCKKYPPSLDFLLMTLGPSILLLGFFDRAEGAFGRTLITLGRVPLFYYLLQWPLVHALALVMALINRQPYRWLLAGEPFRTPPGYGYSLPMVYLMWGLSILLLYSACRWFAELKKRRRDPWLSYL
jgi:uncharacterized membrane protein